MEDSGIDSGDKINSICFETELGTINNKDNTIFIESDNSSNDNVEVVFRSIGSCPPPSSATNLNNCNLNSLLLNDNNGSRLSSASSINSSCNNNHSSNCNAIGNQLDKLNQLNSCKVLQRKLELKVERAKRNYNQLHEDKDPKSKSSTLIPINRLQIPGCQENTPLVEYNSDNSQNDDDDDDNDEISFFPSHKQKHKKQDLSDTFSIQEMTIESDTDESESTNLELLPPTGGDKAIEKCLTCLCCVNQEQQKCTVM